MSDREGGNPGPKADGVFAGRLDQETFRALLFNSFLNQQSRVHATREQRDLLAAIAQTRRELARARDLNAALNLICARAVEITGATGAAIALTWQTDMKCCAVSGATAPPLGAAVSLEFGLSAECVRSAARLRCQDTSTDPRVNREACQRLGGVRSMLLMPLFHQRSTVGILEVFSTRPYAFDGCDENVLDTLSALAALALADFGFSAGEPRGARSTSASVRSSSPPVSPA